MVSVHPHVQSHALTSVSLLEIVHVRVWWIMETLKHPACTIGWIARLSQLAFPKERNLNFSWEKSHWDNAMDKKNKKKKRFHSWSGDHAPQRWDWRGWPQRPWSWKVKMLFFQSVNLRWLDCTDSSAKEQVVISTCGLQALKTSDQLNHACLWPWCQMIPWLIGQVKFTRLGLLLYPKNCQQTEKSVHSLRINHHFGQL